MQQSKTGIFKITNPDIVLKMIPLIEDYVKTPNIPKVYAAAATTYFVQTVINGGINAELWAAFQDKDIVGFARWQVLGLPYLEDVFCDAIYISRKPSVTIVTSLFNQYIEFGKIHNAKRYHAQTHDDKINRVWGKLFDKHGIGVSNVHINYAVGEVK